MLFADAVARTMEDLRRRRRGAATLAAYAADLRLYGRYVARASGRAVDSLTLADCAQMGLSSYLRHLREERCNAAATVARRLAALRALYRCNWHLGGLERDPALLVSYPIGPRRGVRALEIRAARALVRAAVLESRAPLRDALMLMLLVGNGLTLQELTALDCDDVDLARSVLHLRGRTQRERLVPLSESAVRMLRRYLRERPTGPLWSSRRGERLSARGVQYVCARAARRAGLCGASAQALRVTALELMRAAGASDETIRDLLGLRRAG